MRFAPIEEGRGGKLFIRERNALHFYDGGKVTCKGTARSSRALQETEWHCEGGANTSRVNIPPSDDTLTGHILETRCGKLYRVENFA